MRQRRLPENNAQADNPSEQIALDFSGIFNRHTADECTVAMETVGNARSRWRLWAKRFA
jgi:hypothetical protein